MARLLLILVIVVKVLDTIFFQTSNSHFTHMNGRWLTHVSCKVLYIDPTSSGVLPFWLPLWNVTSVKLGSKLAIYEQFMPPPQGGKEDTPIGRMNGCIWIGKPVGKTLSLVSVLQRLSSFSQNFSASSQNKSEKIRRDKLGQIWLDSVLIVFLTDLFMSDVMFHHCPVPPRTDFIRVASYLRERWLLI